MITSCSPGWINFLEKFYPELISHASTCRSPMMMLSVLAKTYYAEKAGIDPKKIFIVAVMPCVAKKYEARRPEHFTADGTPYTDAALTTRELIWMIKCYGINFTALPPGEFDAPLGLAIGAGDIFGPTGGGMEPPRAASELSPAKPADRLSSPKSRRRACANPMWPSASQHPRGRGQRIDQRQNPAGQSQSRQGAVPRDRVMAPAAASAAGAAIRPKASC